jgi:hypothetical protein
MKNLTGRFWGGAAAIFLLFGLLMSAGSVDAQTSKKKTRKKKTTSSVPRPVTPQTMPVIISQADQYQNQPIVTGNVETPVENQSDTPVETFDEKLERVSSRVKTLESSKQNKYDEKQKRLLLNLDILTRAETRAESLRKQLFELIEKENSIRTKLDTIEYDLRPEMIERQSALVGSLRPEQIREARQKSLESEKRNLESLLIGIQATRTSLEQNVQRADQMVEKLRAVLEKDIDDALNEEPKDERSPTKDQ